MVKIGTTWSTVSMPYGKDKSVRKLRQLRKKRKLALAEKKKLVEDQEDIAEDEKFDGEL